MDNKKLVLIVEDEKNIVDILMFNLKRDGYETMEAYDGETGLQLALEQDPDLILLDLMLPKMNGFDVCRSLRDAGRTTPILMLTAREEEADKVLGLELGADDYITKPFSMEELIFRMEAISRRVKGTKNKDITSYRVGSLTFDSPKQTLSLEYGEMIRLTTKECELLSLLCSHQNQILERNYALMTIWGENTYFNARSMDVYITKLRKHLKADPNVQIMNIHGKGYKLVVPEQK
jgi:DNA-binding response OmpR family regulator